MVNITGRRIKFYANDCFGETIIKLNKKKVKSLFNTKLDKFLQKTITLNIMSLWRSKKVLAQATRATRHGSRYFVVDTTPDVDLFVKLLLEIKIFDTQLSQNANRTKFKDLYIQGSITINSGVLLRQYLKYVQDRLKSGGADSDLKTRRDEGVDKDDYTDSSYQSDEF